jgi:hypothetical protein
MTLESWRQAAAAECERQIPIAEDIANRHRGVDTLDELIALLDELVPAAEEGLESFRRIREPDERGAEVRRLGDMYAEQLDTMKQLLQSARSGNASGTNFFVEQMNARSSATVALYEDLGVDACARPVTIG